jgi:hypothetical protein
LAVPGTKHTLFFEFANQLPAYYMENFIQ